MQADKEMMCVVNERIEVAREYIEMIATEGYHSEVDAAWEILRLNDLKDWEGILNVDIIY
ncbi:hypothetical protein D3C85_1000740 [compost metagenome]